MFDVQACAEPAISASAPREATPVQAGLGTVQRRHSAPISACCVRFHEENAWFCVHSPLCCALNCRHLLGRVKHTCTCSALCGSSDLARAVNEALAPNPKLVPPVPPPSGRGTKRKPNEDSDGSGSGSHTVMVGMSGSSPLHPDYDSAHGSDDHDVKPVRTNRRSLPPVPEATDLYPNTPESANISTDDSGKLRRPACVCTRVFQYDCCLQCVKIRLNTTRYRLSCPRRWRRLHPVDWSMMLICRSHLALGGFHQRLKVEISLLILI